MTLQRTNQVPKFATDYNGVTTVAVLMFVTFMIEHSRARVNSVTPWLLRSGLSSFVIAYYNLSFVIRCVTIPELQQKLNKIKMFTSKREILGKNLAISGKPKNIAWRFASVETLRRHLIRYIKHLETWTFESCSEIWRRKLSARCV